MTAAGTRSAGALGLWLFAWAMASPSLGCEGEVADSARPAPAVADGSNAIAEEAATAVPTTRAEFLALAAPVPGQGVTIRYRLSGPANLTGELVVDLLEGGWRREMWSMTLMPGEGVQARRIEGLTLQTPDEAWSGVGDEPGTVTPVPLGPLADVFMAADVATRRTVTTQIVRWRRELASARTQFAGETEEILDHRCLRTQIAGQRLCLWEETGLPLRYEGSEFSLEAFQIEENVSRSPEDFERPEHGAAAVVRPAPPELRLDAAAALEQLARGDMAPLAFVATPGLRMPG